MPEDVEHVVVEPLYVVSHALRYPGDEGETVMSRRKVLGYSLTDPAAAPIDFTAPAIRHDDKPRR